MKSHFILTNFVIIVVLLSAINSNSSTWSKEYGGDFTEEAGLNAYQTDDNGYLIIGTTTAGPPDHWRDPLTYYDLYFVKVDYLGEIIWDKLINVDPRSINFRSVEFTLDGGYIVAGIKSSYDTGSEIKSVYLVKIDSDIGKSWEKNIISSTSIAAHSIIQTTDGGYLISGVSEYRVEGVFETDIYLLKLNSDCDKTWEKTYGGDSEEYAYSVQQTSDGGYIIVGESKSFGFYSNVYLVKVDAAGNMLWEKTFGSSDGADGYSVKQTVDGGYIVSIQKQRI